MVRSLGLKAGDKLVAELIDDRIVLLPKPDSWAEYMIGSLEGVYGSNKEEVDRYIAEVRYGSDVYGLYDALDRDPGPPRRLRRHPFSRTPRRRRDTGGIRCLAYGREAGGANGA